MIQKFTFILIFIFSTFFLNAQFFNESFEGTWSPNPSGWYQEELNGGSGSGTNQWWRQATYDAGNWTPSGSGEPTNSITGSNAAWYNNYEATEGQTDRLATNNIDLSGASNPYVSFYLWYKAGTIDFKLIASNDGGANWNYISSPIEATDDFWKRFTFFLPSEYKVSNARIGFEITTATSMYDIWLDNVIIDDAPPALTGIKTIDNTLPTAGENFNSFTDAFDYLNMAGVGTGGVVFNVIEGQIFNENPPPLTVTGSSNNQIIFQNSATVGINSPKIEAEGIGDSDFAIKLHETTFVTFNGIDINDKSTNFNYDLQIENGFILSNSSSNNTIKNCKVDLSKGNTNFSIGIMTSNGGNNNNSFLNNNITDCSGAYFFGNVSGVDSDTGNKIDSENGGQSIISNIGNSLIATKYFVKLRYQNNFILANTQMTGLTSSEAPAYGIYVQDGLFANSEIYNNTISEITKTGFAHRYAAAIKISAGNHNIYKNEITNISSTGGDVVAIDISSYGENSIFQNTISDIKYESSTFYFASGIYVDISASKVANIYNNIIYDIKAENANTNSNHPINCTGIYVEQGTANIFYNTIYFDYVANNSSNVSSSIYIKNNYTSLDIRNNIFINKVSGSYSKAISFFHNSTDYSDLNTSDNNLFYSGTPSSSNLIFYNGTSGFQTLETYKTHIGNLDQLSVTDDVDFLSISLPYNFHVNTSSLTVIEGGAFPINLPISILYDFDENIRNTTTPDIGAFEDDYAILDLIPPSISYFTIRNTTSTGNYILTDFATIIDASGVDITSNKARLYFKNRNDNNAFEGNTSSDNGWKYVEISNTVLPYNFTIDYSLLYNSAEVVEGDIIEYFVTAQDMATNPNVGANPNEGFSANSVSDIISAPATPKFFFVADIYYDFEEDNDERYTHEPDFGYTEDDWERGTPTGGDFYPTTLPSGVKCWATKLNSNYSSAASYFLNSPMFIATDDLFIFDFSEFLYLDLIQFDKVSVEYRLNNYIWFPLTTEYSRKDTEWSNKVLSLDVSEGDRIEIRWKFETDYYDEYAGWFIDDIFIRGAQIAYNVKFTALDENASPISYPHVWINGATGNDYWLGELDGTRIVNLINGTHSSRINGPHETYQYAEDNFTVADDDLDITVVLSPTLLTFNVTDASTLEPIENADIYVEDTHYFTDETGKIVISGMRTLTYNYTVSATGYENIYGTVNLETGIATENVEMTSNINISKIENNFNIYPNPASNYFYIEGINKNETYNLQITNTLGQAVYNEKITNTSKKDINISSFEKGVYNLSLKSNNSSIIYKIIIQ